MSDHAFRNARLTVEEYLRREARATVRHEYVDGVVYAMTGTTLRHNRIILNILDRLHAAARGSSCSVFVQDVKVRIRDEKFYYPDLSATCVPIEDDEAVFITDPCLIVEVTSTSTKATDRREKVVAYQTIPSLRLYFIVDHRRRRVELHARDAAGAWQRAEVAGRGAIDVPCPVTTLSLDDIYDGVTLPTIRERPRHRYRVGPAPHPNG